MWSSEHFNTWDSTVMWFSQKLSIYLHVFILTWFVMLMTVYLRSQNAHSSCKYVFIGTVSKWVKKNESAHVSETSSRFLSYPVGKKCFACPSLPESLAKTSGLAWVTRTAYQFFSWYASGHTFSKKKKWWRLFYKWNSLRERSRMILRKENINICH